MSLIERPPSALLAADHRLPLSPSPAPPSDTRARHHGARSAGTLPLGDPLAQNLPLPVVLVSDPERLVPLAQLRGNPVERDMLHPHPVLPRDGMYPGSGNVTAEVRDGLTAGKAKEDAKPVLEVIPIAFVCQFEERIDHLPEELPGRLLVCAVQRDEGEAPVQPLNERPLLEGSFARHMREMLPTRSLLDSVHGMTTPVDSSTGQNVR